MAQFDIHAGNQRVIGPVSALPAGSSLPGPVSFSLSGSSVALVAVDNLTVKVQSVAGQVGDSVVVVASGALSVSHTFSVLAAEASDLDAPVSDEQPIG